MMKNFALVTGTGRQRTRFNEIPAYAEGLYDLGSGLYAWMVPNGSWGESNAGLIIGDAESLLVDTLWDLRYTREMLDAMQPIVARVPIRTLVNTHADGDHFFGNQLLPGVNSITSDASLNEMLATQPKAMNTLAKLGKALGAMGRLPGFGKYRQVGHWFQNMGAPYNFGEVTHTPAKNSFKGEMTLKVGAREVQLIEVGPAHTHGDLMVYVPDKRVLFAGDVLFIDSTPVMWAGPVETWLAALDKIDALNPKIIVPGHGPITDRLGVATVRAYWIYVSKRAREHHARGASAEQAARDIVLHDNYKRQPFANWNSPERIMTSVHTLYRHFNGDTQTPGIPQLISILRKQALLAHELPDAQPQIMRLKATLT